MAHLFERIPETLFTVLSSPNRKIYVDCLFIIYDATNSIEDAFQGERNYVIGKLIDYFDEQKSDLRIEEDEEASTSRQKAVAVINVLKANGWLGEEELGDYKTSLNLFDYSIKIIDLLKRIQQDEQLEYTGEIYTVYSLLASFELENGYTIIEQAYHKIDDVLRTLKTLRANIYRYYHDLVKSNKKDNLQEVLERLLVDYKINFFDSAYYKLKTTDSLPRYKRSIMENINRIYNSESMLEELALQAMKAKNYAEFNDAFNYIEARIRYIRDSIEAMEYLINSIDEKNEMYINAAASKIMFLTNTSEDFEGLLNRLFQIILKEKQFDYSQIFNLFRARNLDDASLYTVRRKRVDPIPEEIDYDQDIPEDIKREKLRTIMKQNVFSKVEINKHVNYLLEDKEVIKASEVPLETNEDFVKLILIFLYSKSIGMSYDVRLLTYDVKIGDIRFSEFEIMKKGTRR
ncbi:Wadjet anti-phage system protein JetA family protein [Acholeplasma equifetale]|uniref:Wadjet anti-phage system protein JetA family protein n=1 Tax=Acholeplasma equifetale TaxID=264634 RepID=UPI00138ACD19|nr:Wadjet anti-phage system protein JetA family protein [Acholeplasma equifetale]